MTIEVGDAVRNTRDKYQALHDERGAFIVTSVRNVRQGLASGGFGLQVRAIDPQDPTVFIVDGAANFTKEE